MNIKGRIKLEDNKGILIFSAGEIFHQSVGNIENIRITMSEAKFIMDNHNWSKDSKQYFLDDKVIAFSKIRDMINQYVGTPIDIVEIHAKEEKAAPEAPAQTENYWA